MTRPATEEILSQLINAMPDGISVIDSQGVHLLVNDAFCRMVQIPREELLGAGTPHPYWPPEHLDAIVAAFGETVVGEGATYDLTFRRRDGERFPVSVRPAMVEVGGKPIAIGIVRDMSKQRAHDAELARTQQLVETMLKGGDMAWWMWHLADGWAEVSESYFTQLGYEPGAWEPSYDAWAARVHPDDIGEADKRMQALIADRSRLFDSEHRFRDADGKWRWMLMRGYVVERAPDGSPAAVMGTYQDIHHLKTQEATLQQFAKMEVVGQMAGGFAHDFNNLLMIMVGNLDLLRGELPSEALETFDEVEDALRRAGRLTTSLLAFARGQKPTELRACDVNEILEASRRMVQGSLGQGVELRYELGSIDRSVELIPERLETAIVNLAINARDAIRPEPGEVIVSTRMRTLAPAAAERCGVPAGLYVAITVADDGKGMTPEVLERACDPLFTTKQTGKGTGLGLSMVRRLVTDCRGAMTIESQSDEGCKVELLFPAVIDAARPDAVEIDLPEDTPRGNETLLVLDDEASLTRVLGRQLEMLGYDVITSENPRRALVALQETPVDLLLTDIVMPYTLNGIELAERARLLRPTMPILFMSGYADEPALQTARELGPVLRKPFSLLDLARGLRELLDDRSD